MRRFARLLGFLAVALACCLLLGAVVPRPLWRAGGTAEQDGRTRRILVVANPIHTDLAFPPDPDVLQALRFIDADGLPVNEPSVGWIILGWGGRAFYTQTPTWSELRPLPLFKGVTLDASVMHVALAGPIDPDDPDIVPLDLPEAEFAHILAAVVASFKRDVTGETELLEGESYGRYDLFYEAEGRFTAMMGCNTWTSAVLREGGLRTGWWNPLPQSLFFSLRRFNPLAEVGPQAIPASASKP